MNKLLLVLRTEYSKNTQYPSYNMLILTIY